MIDFSSEAIQALLWSASLWLGMPVLVSLVAGVQERSWDRDARQERATNLAFWLWEALALGPLAWFYVQSILDIKLGADIFSLPRDAVAFCLALWLGDGIASARHRLEHSRMLWRWHAWHHTVDATDWLQTHRHHPISRLIAFSSEVVLLAALMAVIFGSTPWPALLAAMTCRRAYAIWLHSGSNWGMDSWIAGYFVLPGHHRAHHAGAPIYSGMFRHWDLLWPEAPSRIRDQRISLG